LEIWEKLLEKAIRYIRHSALPCNAERINWSLGGGTVLMMKYHHRLSRDIDIFLANPQFLGYFSPRVNDRIEADVEDYDEQAEYVKLFYGEGEIDFIVADRLLGRPYNMFFKFGAEIPREDPLEIIAKKIFYRHKNFAKRDFFDLATVLSRANEAEVLEIQKFIAPFVGYLHVQLEKVQSFDEINILPEGEAIRRRGKTLISELLDSISDVSSL
jgi:hypothetical protein